MSEEVNINVNTEAKVEIKSEIKTEGDAKSKVIAQAKQALAPHEEKFAVMDKELQELNHKLNEVDVKLRPLLDEQWKLRNEIANLKRAQDDVKMIIKREQALIHAIKSSECKRGWGSPTFDCAVFTLRFNNPKYIAKITIVPAEDNDKNNMEYYVKLYIYNREILDGLIKLLPNFDLKSSTQVLNREEVTRLLNFCESVDYDYQVIINSLPYKPEYESDIEDLEEDHKLVYGERLLHPSFLEDVTIKLTSSLYKYDPTFEFKTIVKDGVNVCGLTMSGNLYGIPYNDFKGFKIDDEDWYYNDDNSKCSTISGTCENGYEVFEQICEYVKEYHLCFKADINLEYHERFIASSKYLAEFYKLNFKIVSGDLLI